MSERMTPERLAEIAARRAAVTEQPLWEASTNWHWDVGIYSAWAEGRSHFTNSSDATEDEMKAALVLAEADAEFIANAPDDIRDLLADNAALRDALKASQQGAMWFKQMYDDAFFTMKNIVNSVPDKPQSDIDVSYRNGRKDAAVYAQGWLQRAKAGTPFVLAVNEAAGQESD